MKILIVEDDGAIASAIRGGLDEAGYFTSVCRDGERALRLAKASSFSLILLDLMLPSMDGMTLCRHLRDARINTPVLMITAKDTIPDRVAGLEAGADDYLCKPFEYEELLARVRALLRRDHAVKQSRIQVADLVVDTSAHTVMRSGKAISLTGREYTLLEALSTHSGQILSREAIQERIWMDNSVSNVVDVYIRNLRRKVDDNFGVKLIHTVYGLGYVLKSDEQVAIS